MDVSRLVLGTMYFGTRTDERTSRALLDRFVDAGGTTLDTANCYSFWSDASGHGGQSEETLGRWLAADGSRRDRVQLATKVGVEPLDHPRPDGAAVEGLSADVVRAGCEASLRRLGVDVIDLYWAHGEDRGTPLEESVEAFGALVQAGSVRRLGVSNHATWRVERGRSIALDRGLEPWTALQLTTSYLHPRPGAAVEGKDHRFGFVTDETIDYVAEHPDVELWAYSPLVQGAYDRADRPFPEPYEHPGSTRRLAVLDEVATDHGVPRSVVVLAWLMASQPQIRPIVGVSGVEQLDSALRVADVDLTSDELAALDAPS
ncbi:aldo/keto reductase [Aeromicrobium sp.]|uniref:aldo/keto reductase n=1 Tax=Aeromicrobium sp. TaxID=1871063 RepID=UPI0040343FDC